MLLKNHRHEEVRHPFYRALFHPDHEGVPPAVKKRQVALCESPPSIFVLKKNDFQAPLSLWLDLFKEFRCS